MTSGKGTAGGLGSRSGGVSGGGGNDRPTATRTASGLGPARAARAAIGTRLNYVTTGCAHTAHRSRGPDGGRRRGARAPEKKGARLTKKGEVGVASRKEKESVPASSSPTQQNRAPRRGPPRRHAQDGRANLAMRPCRALVAASREGKGATEKTIDSLGQLCVFSQKPRTLERPARRRRWRPGAAGQTCRDRRCAGGGAAEGGWEGRE